MNRHLLSAYLPVEVEYFFVESPVLSIINLEKGFQLLLIAYDHNICFSTTLLKLLRRIVNYQQKPDEQNH